MGIQPTSIILKQVYFLVGWIPFALVASGREVYVRNSFLQGPCPSRQTHHRYRPLWTQTSLDSDSTGQRPPNHKGMLSQQ